MQNYVSQLRRALGANGGGGPLETHGRGYRLRVEPMALDLERFERCLESGRAALAAGEPERAAADFRAGLGMWRGPPLPELDDTAEARVEIDRVLERRVVALEGRVEADLACGRHAELIAELEAAVAREPLRERLRGQLMLALYRCGRQAEALEVHRDGRRVLAEQLGLEPGPALTRLERAILEHDPALDPPPPATPPRRGTREREPGRRRLTQCRGDPATGAAGDQAQLPCPQRAGRHMRGGRACCAVGRRATRGPRPAPGTSARAPAEAPGGRARRRAPTSRCGAARCGDDGRSNRQGGWRPAGRPPSTKSRCSSSAAAIASACLQARGAMYGTTSVSASSARTKSRSPARWSGVSARYRLCEH